MLGLQYFKGKAFRGDFLQCVPDEDQSTLSKSCSHDFLEEKLEL